MSILNGAWVAAQTWALEAGAYRSLMAAVQAGGLQAAPAPSRSSRSSGAVAVVPIRGFISPRSSPLLSFFGGVGVDAVVDQVRRAVADPGIAAVVLDVDSPGGEVAGVPEAAAALRGLRGRGTPIVAVSNTVMASAAYWLASQADRVLASPSSLTGSIGVYAGHVDESVALEKAVLKVSLIHFGQRKVDGASTVPLSDRARADIQNRVDQFGRAFERDVAVGRRVSVATVQARFGQGAIFTATDAKAAGLVDEVATFEHAIKSPAQLKAERLTAECERDSLRLAAGFSASELEGTKRRATEEATRKLQAYVDRGFRR